MQRARIFASVVTLFVASIACAQGAPGGRPAGGPPGIGAGGGGAPDPSMIVNRFFEGDKNGDGKLSKDEVPAPFAERGFEAADANKDGSIDRDELTAFMKGQAAAGGRGGEGRGEGRGGEGRGGEGRGPRANFESTMKQAGRGMKGLEKSGFTAETKAADLEAIANVEAGLAASKALIGQVKMSDAAKKKFGTDEAAFRMELRKQLHETMKAALALEEAVLAGNSGDAKAAYGRLGQSAEAGHKLFKQEEE